MSEPIKIKIPKYYEWVIWFYDGTIMTQYIPEHNDMNVFDRMITEAYNYHLNVSKVKRAGWLAISTRKATFVNIKARYMEAVAKPLRPLIFECHGEFPFITRSAFIRYSMVEGEPVVHPNDKHEYIYIIGIGGNPINKDYNGLVFLEPKTNGNYACVDMDGNVRFDLTTEIIPAIPPEAADTMPQIVREIRENLKDLKVE